jgi:sarcosine oxidase subunit beta
MRTADIVIIGGGIVGVNIAYQLALQGATNVLLLERDEIASGSSGRATGGLRQQFADALDIRFSQEGVRFYKQFTEEHTDAPVKPPVFHQHGYLFLVTTPVSWQAMQRHVALQQSLGVPTQLITPAEAQQHVPQLNVEDVLGASFCPTDGYSDTQVMTRALAYTAQAEGVTIQEHRPVLGITVEHGRVQAVHTAQEIIATTVVINAAGAYATFIAQYAGINDFPVRPLRRQLYLTKPFLDLPQDVPMTVDLSTGFHFRRRGERVVLTMPLPISEEEELANERMTPEAFALSVNEQFWPLLQAEARRRYPPLADALIERFWSGLYEMTPDEHPVLGKTEIEGFFCACGFSGHGFMHAPMAAKLISELLLNGASTTLDIEQFYLERFRTGKLLETTRLL